MDLNDLRFGAYAFNDDFNYTGSSWGTLGASDTAQPSQSHGLTFSESASDAHRPPAGGVQAGARSSAPNSQLADPLLLTDPAARAEQVRQSRIGLNTIPRSKVDLVRDFLDQQHQAAERFCIANTISMQGLRAFERGTAKVRDLNDWQLFLKSQLYADMLSGEGERKKVFGSEGSKAAAAAWEKVKATPALTARWEVERDSVRAGLAPYEQADGPKNRGERQDVFGRYMDDLRRKAQAMSHGYGIETLAFVVSSFPTDNCSFTVSSPATHSFSQKHITDEGSMLEKLEEYVTGERVGREKAEEEAVKLLERLSKRDYKMKVELLRKGVGLLMAQKYAEALCQQLLSINVHRPLPSTLHTVYDAAKLQPLGLQLTIQGTCPITLSQLKGYSSTSKDQLPTMLNAIQEGDIAYTVVDGWEADEGAEEALLAALRGRGSKDKGTVAWQKSRKRAADNME
ncbi:hypothetical protein JCM5296_000964 [Sporobolomyces johnsonii]